jgi:hypothetical protein
MARPTPSLGGAPFEIVIEDADGRQLCIEWADEPSMGRARLTSLAAIYTGMPLILRDRRTQTVLYRSEDS